MATADYGSVAENVWRFSANYTVRFALAGVVVYCCWIGIVQFYWFTWHVVLCTFGYVPLMAEAIMMFTGDDIWSRQLNRKTKYIVHGILISVATAITIVGNALAFHYLAPGYHLYTAHGITGLVSMIILILSLALGLAANYSQEMKRYLSLSPVWYKLLHNIFGLLGYAIGIASLCFAYYSNWFKYYSTEESRVVCLIVTIVGCLWTINGALVSGYNQIKTVLGK